MTQSQRTVYSLGFASSNATDSKLMVMNHYWTLKEAEAALAKSEPTYWAQIITRMVTPWVRTGSVKKGKPSDVIHVPLLEVDP